MSDHECKRCGAFIKNNQVKFCSICSEKNRTDIVNIKEVIIETKLNDLATISRESGVSIKVINMLVEDNSLILK